MPKVEKNQRNLERCRCPFCPSYNMCARAKNQAIFCADEVGKSSCDFTMLGCLCGDCPVYQENKLMAGYYCMRGSADHIDYLNKMD